MRTYCKMVDYGGSMVDRPTETALLSRIGTELAEVYHDTLDTPLPAEFRELLDRLDTETARVSGVDGES